VLMVGVPAVVVGCYTALHSEWITGAYLVREFTLPERLMTSARALWFYLRLIVAPDLSIMGLYHDDFQISKSLDYPVTTLPAILGVVALVATVFLFRTRARVLAFGISWFLVGHLLESSVFPLEIMHEHRNYIPSFGILFAIIYYATYADWGKMSLRLRYAAVALLIGLFGFMTYIRADQWANLFDHAAIEAYNHPRSDRANYQLGRMYQKLLEQQFSDEYFEKARFYFRKAADTGMTAQLGGLFGLIHLNFMVGKPLDRQAYDQLLDRLQTWPLAPSSTNFVDQLSACQTSGACKLSDEQFMALVQAAIANPRASSMQLANLYTIAGVYYFNRMARPELSEVNLRKALEVEGENPQRCLNLARFYTMTAEFETAERLIQRAGVLDRRSVASREIARERELLAQARDASETQKNN
jgi:TPR repeat protein